MNPYKPDVLQREHRVFYDLYKEERLNVLFQKDTDAMFLVAIGRYKDSRLGVRPLERMFATIRKRQL